MKKIVMSGYSKKELAKNGIPDIVEKKLLEIIEDQAEAKNGIISIQTSGESPYSDGSQFGSDECIKIMRAHEIKRCGNFKPYLHLAMLKIENNTFGICECGAGNQETRHLIPIERLKAVPWARTCVGCKNQTVNVLTAITMLSKLSAKQVG